MNGCGTWDKRVVSMLVSGMDPANIVVGVSTIVGDIGVRVLCAHESAIWTPLGLDASDSTRSIADLGGASLEAWKSSMLDRLRSKAAEARLLRSKMFESCWVSKRIKGRDTRSGLVFLSGQVGIFGESSKARRGLVSGVKIPCAQQTSGIRGAV